VICTKRSGLCGAVAEWSKALAWKVSIRQKRIEGSNPSRSASDPQHLSLITVARREGAGLAGLRGLIRQCH
jgi:hypothetical protein